MWKRIVYTFKDGLELLLILLEAELLGMAPLDALVSGCNTGAAGTPALGPNRSRASLEERDVKDIGWCCISTSVWTSGVCWGKPIEPALPPPGYWTTGEGVCWRLLAGIPIGGKAPGKLTGCCRAFEEWFTLVVGKPATEPPNWGRKFDDVGEFKLERPPPPPISKLRPRRSSLWEVGSAWPNDDNGSEAAAAEVALLIGGGAPPKADWKSAKSDEVVLGWAVFVVVAIVGALRKSPKSLVSPPRGSKSSIASDAGEGGEGFILKLLLYQF